MAIYTCNAIKKLIDLYLKNGRRFIKYDKWQVIANIYAHNKKLGATY